MGALESPALLERDMAATGDDQMIEEADPKEFPGPGQSLSQGQVFRAGFEPARWVVVRDDHRCRSV